MPRPNMPLPFEGVPFNIPIADVSFVKHKYLDIVYASSSPTQKLDIYLPSEGVGPFPIMFVIHGGGFEIGDKRDVTLLSFLEGIKYGFAVVSVNYRLSREAQFPAAVQDVKAAMRWIRAHHEEYSLDPERIAALGGSAGGNLAAMLGTTGRTTDFDDPVLGNLEFSSEVHAVVDWFGPLDFLAMDEQHAQNGVDKQDHSRADSPESKYLGALITTFPELVKKANPVTYLHPGVPPFFIQHGNRDDLVPYQQSQNLAEAIKRIAPGALAHFELLDGAGHGDPLFETPENMAKVFAFLEKTLVKTR